MIFPYFSPDFFSHCFVSLYAYHTKKVKKKYIFVLSLLTKERNAHTSKDRRETSISPSISLC